MRPRILVTRNEDPSGPLHTALAHEGLEPLPFPCVRMAPFAEEVKRVRRDLATDPPAWIAFTSAFAVQTVGQPPDGCSARVAAVGRGTAAALDALGWSVDVVGPGGGAGPLARVWTASASLSGSRVLLPCSAASSATLGDLLRGAGAEVDVRALYAPIHPEPDPELLAELEDGQVHGAAFCSASAVRGFASSLRRSPGISRMQPPQLFAIGRPTAAAVRDVLDRHCEVAPATSYAALAGCIARVFREGAPVRTEAPTTRTDP